MSEPCAVCNEPLTNRDMHELPVLDKEPVSITDALRGLGQQTMETVFVHHHCIARARDEFQPYRSGAPRFAPLPTFCVQCQSEISNESCWCGDDIDHEAWNHGHSPVPMGCTCSMESP